VAGTVGQIVLWSQVVSGMELDRVGVARVLDTDAWHQRRQRLGDLGKSSGSPTP
jgi:hypothetical protein